MKHVKFADRDCVIEKSHYQNGRVALQLVDAATGEPCATATINLPAIPLGRDEAFIKDHGENAGILSALVEAGIVRPTGRTVHSGIVEVHRVTLLPPFRDYSPEELRARRTAIRRQDPPCER